MTIWSISATHSAILSINQSSIATGLSEWDGVALVFTASDEGLPWVHDANSKKNSRLNQSPRVALSIDFLTLVSMPT